MKSSILWALSLVGILACSSTKVGQREDEGGDTQADGSSNDTPPDTGSEGASAGGDTGTAASTSTASGSEDGSGTDPGTSDGTGDPTSASGGTDTGTSDGTGTIGTTSTGTTSDEHGSGEETTGGQQGCHDSNECRGIERCFKPDESIPCGACTEDPSCASDQECGRGWICEPDACSCSGGSVCVLGCSDDDACQVGQACESLRCVGKQCLLPDDCPVNFECSPTAISRCIRETCTNDDQCEGYCVEGSCYDTLGYCSLVPP